MNPDLYAVLPLKLRQDQVISLHVSYFVLPHESDYGLPRVQYIQYA